MSRLLLLSLVLAATAHGQRVPTTLADFHLPGTQMGDLPPDALQGSAECRECHEVQVSDFDPGVTWAGSLMAQGARDPLFFAQLTTANQDAAEAGYFCMRCHLPLTFVTGHAVPADGSAVDEVDLDGVTCHFCHSLVDPLMRDGLAEDEAALATLAEAPAHFGNAMFVLDPSGTLRGARGAVARHETLVSSFLASSDLCGTCHDVGNPNTQRQADGTWRYGALDTASPTQDPLALFPLERTYTEWKLSDFARGGVDQAGRFAEGPVETCQDCHMPRGPGWVSTDSFEVREDLAAHSFAGAAAPVLDLIAALYPEQEPAIARARRMSVSMLERALTLELRQTGRRLVVRAINETGHKLPTGHIEGRRVWLNLRFLDSAGGLLEERGHYDEAEAELHAEDTRVYEMHVGLSEAAAAATGLPAGPTGHMALADTIELDSRIPPRGFRNAAFEAAGAPVVHWAYADGQHWDEARFAAPPGATRAVVTAYYQSTPRHYIEALRDANVTDDRGDMLFALWEATGRGAPIPMASATLDLADCDPADCDGDGVAEDCDDHDAAVHPGAPERCNGLDDDCDGAIDEGVAEGEACDSGRGGQCGPGELHCREGVLRCDPLRGPTDETCDGADEDCDGEVDEDYRVGAPCTVPAEGCALEGLTECRAGGEGAWCRPLQEACPEVDASVDAEVVADAGPDVAQIAADASPEPADAEPEAADAEPAAADAEPEATASSTGGDCGCAQLRPRSTGGPLAALFFVLALALRRTRALGCSR